MGLYILLDVASDIDGDLQLSDSGDLKLGTTQESQASVLNFWLRTDHADYAAGRDVGANLGEYVGDNMSEETLTDMRNQTFDSLVKNLIYPEDLFVEVVPFDYDEALVVVQMKGNYMNADGEFEVADPQVFTYTFPFIDGTVIPA